MGLNIKSKKIDLIVLLCLLAIALAYSAIAADSILGKPLIVGILMCIPGSLYLGWRSPKPWKKIIYATLIFGVLCGFLFEFIQVSAGAYFIANTVFPKLFGVLPPDNFLGHGLMALMTFTFYEHFINNESTKKISPRIKHVLYPVIVASIAVVVLHYTRPDLLIFEYSYAILATIALLPLARLVTTKPKYIRDVTLIVPYFFVAYILFELIAVKYNWWLYPAEHYIGYVELFNLRFPFEEFFFWIMLYSAALVSYYKTYMDPPSKIKKS